MVKQGSILIDSLPDAIVQAVVQHRTSLGNNPAVPDIYDTPYLLKACKAEFEKAKEKLENIGKIDNVSSTTIDKVLGELITKCIKIEQPHRNELEQLCYNYAIDLLSVPDESVGMALSLCDSVDTGRDSIILDPEDEDIEFNDVGSALMIKREVYKRRFLDVMCYGAALSIAKRAIIDCEEDLKKINEELPSLYNDILALNKYALFEKEDLGMTEENKMQLGVVEITLGNDETMTKIESQGVIFPILVCETMRGFFELFISHGLPKEIDMAKAVLRKADFLKAEPWDMRLGPFIWRKISKSFNDIDFADIPYLFKRISSLEISKFNFLMKEVLAGTIKGRRIMSSICAKAKDDEEYDKFVDKMDKIRADRGVISDEYIHENEL